MSGLDSISGVTQVPQRMPVAPTAAEGSAAEEARESAAEKALEQQQASSANGLGQMIDVRA